MRNPLKSQGSTNLGLLAARLPLGVQFAWMGIDKFRILGLSKFVDDHLAQVPKYMPPWFGPNYLKALPFAEIVFGIMIVSGFLTRTAGFFLSAMLVSFLMIFGVADSTTSGNLWHFHPNFVYLGLSLLCFFAGGGGISLDNALFGKKGGGGSRDYE